MTYFKSTYSTSEILTNLVDALNRSKPFGCFFFVALGSFYNKTASVVDLELGEGPSRVSQLRHRDLFIKKHRRPSPSEPRPWGAL